MSTATVSSTVAIGVFGYTNTRMQIAADDGRAPREQREADAEAPREQLTSNELQRLVDFELSEEGGAWKISEVIAACH
jgi:hypothetical protein